MFHMTFDELIAQANSVRAPRNLTQYTWVGGTAAALLSESGKVYTGVCIDVCCGMGFCAEHAAIAAMITAGESKILKIVAVGEDGIVPPCGRCREFICQVHDDNINAEVMVAENRVINMKELLPFRWHKAND
jgi:cytidine deaminase